MTKERTTDVSNFKICLWSGHAPDAFPEHPRLVLFTTAVLERSPKNITCIRKEMSE